jgi:hypothetical protein
VQPDLGRLIGIALVAATIAGFALASLASLGLVPAPLWAPSVTVGAVASAALLLLFFHPWLVVGLAIDAGLIWAAVGGFTPAGSAIG